MKVSEIILQQIGGAGKISAMIGVKHFINLSDGLGGLGIRFTARALKKINYIEVRLNGLDLYDVKFIKIANFENKIASEHTDIYFDELKKLIETETGLYLSL